MGSQADGMRSGWNFATEYLVDKVDLEAESTSYQILASTFEMAGPIEKG